MTGPVLIAPSGPEDERVWRLVDEFADLMIGLPWTLIGGLMVRAVEAEHGVRVTTWTTVDLDAVIDVRTDPIATEEASRRLIGVGFEPRGRSRGSSIASHAATTWSTCWRPITSGDAPVWSRCHQTRRSRRSARDRPSAGAET